MYARVPQSMAQFVLKIEKLSHIMGTAPIVELARAYGLHPRLWLLIYANSPGYRPHLPLTRTGHQISRTAGKKRMKYIFETYFGRFLALWGKNWIFDAFFRDFIGRSRAEKVKFAISRISIYLGWHL